MVNILVLNFMKCFPLTTFLLTYLIKPQLSYYFNYKIEKKNKMLKTSSKNHLNRTNSQSRISYLNSLSEIIEYEIKSFKSNNLDS